MGAMGKKPRRITGRSWRGAGRETPEGTRPQGDPWRPSLPEVSHPLYTSPHRHTTSQSHPPTYTFSILDTHHTLRSCGPSALPTLLSSLSTARGQSHVQRPAPLFPQHHPGMVPLVPLREVWPRRRGRGLSHLSGKPRSHIQPSKKKLLSLKQKRKPGIARFSFFFSQQWNHFLKRTLGKDPSVNR